MDIVLLGSGGVANSLAFALKDHLTALFSRQLEHAQELSRKLALPYPILVTDQLKELPLNAHFYILAVRDDAVREVAEALGSVHRGIVVHTSAVTPLDALGKHPRCAVLYPPNTFSKGVIKSFEGFTFLTECSSADVQEEVSVLCRLMGADSLTTTYHERVGFHLAAVFACNFTNHLYYLAEQIMEQSLGDAALTHKLLAPLIEETCRKALQTNPFIAQTGPAIRRDSGTLALHRTLLKNHPEKLRALYDQFTQSIQETYE